jgi:DHA1 family tetracycline resistance protein-like MFS transporter
VDSKRLRTVFLVVFIDLLGFSLILPLLPFYAESYGAAPALVGLLVASYAAAQLFGAPLLGRLSDRYGRRPILVVSEMGTLLGFVLLGLAEPLGEAIHRLGGGAAGAVPVGSVVLGVLFLSRIIDGLTGGNISVAQAYIADITDTANRARGFGLIGAAFGLGFIIGPAIGGTLSVWGYQVPAFAAAGFSLLALVSILLWLPESLSDEQRAALAQGGRPGLTLRALIDAFRRPRVGPLLSVRFVFGLAFATFQTIFPLYAQTRLALSAQSTAYVLTYVGALVVLIQGGGIRWISKRFPEAELIVASVGLMALALLGWAAVANVVLLLVILIPLALSGGILNTILNAALSKVVTPDEVGGTLGISASVESLSRVVAPSAGGYLIGALGPAAPGLVSGVLLILLFPYAWLRLIARPDPPLTMRPTASQAVAGEREA